MEECHIDHSPDTWPPWGTLALDAFMLNRWRPASDLPDDKQRQGLVQEYVKLSNSERHRYAEKASRGDMKPTEYQVATILRPLRDPRLRHVVKLLDDRESDSDPQLWLRLDYQDDERHAAFCKKLPFTSTGPVLAENLYYGSTILSDRQLYDSKTWRQVLEQVPEIIVASKYLSELDEEDVWTSYRREAEVEYMAADHDSDDAGTRLALLHHIYVATVLLVEDMEMFRSDPPRFLMLCLDNLGDVVRSSRILAGDADSYFVMVREGMGAEEKCWIFAELGPKYRDGPPSNSAT